MTDAANKLPLELKISSLTCSRSIQVGEGNITFTLTSPLDQGVTLAESSLASLLLALETEMATIRAAYQSGMISQTDHDTRVLESRRRFMHLVSHLQPADKD